MTNGSEEISALRDEVRNLARQISGLEKRIALLEKAPVPVGETSNPIDEGMESRLGLTWVNRIGAVTLAIGVLFLFNYAVEKQWITIWGRILLGLLTGVALVAFSDVLLRRDQKIFSQGVYGCGVAIFYISLYFGFDEYRSHHPSAVSATCVLTLLFALLFFVGLRWRRSLLLSFNVLWTIIAAGLLLHSPHPNMFASFVLFLAVVHFVASLKPTSPQRIRSALYVLSHICLLIAAMQWLVTGIRHHVPPADQLSVINESLSFLYACYAVVMITVGFVRRQSLDRLLGLAALGIVVLKLYLYDIWQLDRFYRISAFVALGVLLLAASYLYSRWKDKLDALWSGTVE
jgi:uncharacterized membrane protein